MKLTKSKLKQLIKEELNSLFELGEPELKSGIGKVLARKIAAASGVKQLLAQLKDKDSTQRSEFVAYFAQLLGVEAAGADISRVKAAQQQQQKQAAAVAPPEESAV